MLGRAEISDTVLTQIEKYAGNEPYLVCFSCTEAKQHTLRTLRRMIVEHKGCWNQYAVLNKKRLQGFGNRKVGTSRR